MTRDQLIAYSIKYEGEISKIKQALLCNEPYTPVLTSLNVITILDDDYPVDLKNLTAPPYVLYYKGDLKLLQAQAIAVVGSRLPKDYAVMMTKDVVNCLAQRYVIISGLAKGIDALAHHTSLPFKSTIAVLGCGIDRIYPKENTDLFLQIESQGLILSEYPKMSLPLKHHFPNRNRIVAALSKAVVVMQADLKSGALITVNEALDLGKDIYTIPYDLMAREGQGCNLLIQQGAYMILNHDDLLNV